MNLQEEKELFGQIQKGSKKAFEHLFHRYYQNMCVYATRILADDVAAEEIVQDLFVNIWEKRAQLEIKTSVKNYLVRAVKNQCLNLIKHNKIKDAHARQVISQNEYNNETDENFVEVDLMEKIEESINSLPEKRQQIFRLSREEGLKYREIAEKLNVSIKTVETQMGLAMKTLREKLKHYNTFFTLFCVFIRK